MKLLICTSFNILTPSAGKNRLNRMRHALTPHGIEPIIVGAGDPGQAEPWRLRDTLDGPCITYNPNRVRVWRHSRAMTIGAQAARFYKDYLAELIEEFKCSGIIDYSFQGQVSRNTLSAAREKGVFIIADAVEYVNLSMHYLFNGIILEQAKRCHSAIPKMDGLIGISKAWCNWASQRGVPNVWIPSFADDHNYFRNHSSNKSKFFTVVFIGHWIKRELPTVILKAVRICFAKGLIVNMKILGNVGKSYREQSIFRFLNRHPEIANQINLLGFVSDQERDRYLANSDAFIVLRPDTRETDMLFPTRLPEYLLTGNPVIISKVGSFPHCFQHRKDVWFLSKNNHPEELAEAILHLAQHPEERFKIGQKGRQTALDHFSMKVLGDRLAIFIKNIHKTHLANS